MKTLLRTQFEGDLAGLDHCDLRLFLPTELAVRNCIQQQTWGTEAFELDFRQSIVRVSLRQIEKGMGIGLAVSRSIMENHGGRLWAAHNKTGGAVFNVTLPLSQAGPGICTTITAKVGR